MKLTKEELDFIAHMTPEILEVFEEIRAKSGNSDSLVKILTTAAHLIIAARNRERYILKQSPN